LSTNLRERIIEILCTSYFNSFFLTPQISHALTPPLSEEELQRDADLIVVGEVSQAVECLGILEETECFKQWQYFASLKVQGLVKGRVEEGQKIKIIFYQNDYSKSDCVGDQGAVLQSGDRGTYYLKQEKNGSYSPLHWNAVKLIHSGGNSLPKCD
jgi:hypothetical protein